MTTVLIIDDEPDLRATIAEIFERDGFHVVEAGDGETGIRGIEEAGPDLLLLDLGLPDGNGFDILRTLRSQGSLPVIVISGRDSEVDRVLGLELGADDYVVKPFSNRELVARARAVLRRSSEPSHPSENIVAGDLSIDVSSREVFLRDEPVSLTAREFDLLAYLAASPRKVFTHARLLNDVWGSRLEWQRLTTVAEHIYRIRKKIEDEPAVPRHIVTVRGSGYRFEP